MNEPHFVFAIPTEGSVRVPDPNVAPPPLRHALATGMPVVIASGISPREADAYRSGATALGVEAFSLPERTLAEMPRPFEARAFALEPDALRVQDSRGDTVRWPYAAVGLIVRGDSQTTTVELVEPLTALPQDKETYPSSRTDERRETTSFLHFALLYTLEPPGAVRLTRELLDYRGLGDALEPASAANFGHLLKHLGASCRSARWDARLEGASGRLPGVPAELSRTCGWTGLAEPFFRTTSVTGDGDRVAVAAALLFLAERERRRARRSRSP
ncbi:MAG: hypothetical protein L0216_20630 [Planctomycetales bacterium]|nr:hypothetical protein [Planctomycetales bacterium]